jgi:hypothetical protein
VPSRPANGVEIVKPDTWLGNGERICRRRYYSSGNERLEVGDGCDSQIDIIPPPCNYRVTLYTGMPVLFKKREIGFSHAVECVGFENRIADKIIGFTGSIATDFP